MEKLNKLIQKCKCSVNLTINAHRDYYETVTVHQNIKDDSLEDIDPEIYNKMKELNTVVELQFYPYTPIGSYTIYHYDVEKAIDEALNILN